MEYILFAILFVTYLLLVFAVFLAYKYFRSEDFVMSDCNMYDNKSLEEMRIEQERAHIMQAAENCDNDILPVVLDLLGCYDKK